MTSLEVLLIYLHDVEIGSIVRMPGDRHVFSFNQNYIDNENRPTLSLSFKDIYGGLITNTKSTQTRLPPFFSNLLPEGMLREYLAKQAGVKPQREFYMLWILGADLPGALKALPAEGQPLPIEATHDLKKGEGSRDVDNIFHFSLAGVQLKFSAMKSNERGLTIPMNGVGGSWIVKLPDARYEHVPENEYAMMALAQAVGIDIPQTMLLPLEDIQGLPEELRKEGGNAFAIKRFDRSETSNLVHIEDFAQVFNVYESKKYGHASYRNIAEIIWVEMGEVGIVEFIRRLVFNILIGNGDMHLKNWSIIYPDQRTPMLAPGYDFVSTIPYIKNDTLALSLSGEKNFTAISRVSFSKLAAKASLPEKLILDTVTETLDCFHQQWKAVNNFGLQANIKQVIDKHLNSLQL